jgi:uncharacterized protein YggE
MQHLEAGAVREPIEPDAHLNLRCIIENSTPRLHLEDTMKKINIFCIILLAGMVLSACVGATPTAVATNNGSNTGQQPAPRTISVTGEGKAEGAPDIAVASLGVETRDPSVSKAVAENNQKANAITKAVLGLGVGGKDIQTTGFNVYFQDVFDPIRGRLAGGCSWAALCSRWRWRSWG